MTVVRSLMPGSIVERFYSGFALTGVARTETRQPFPSYAPRSLLHPMRMSRALRPCAPTLYAVTRKPSSNKYGHFPACSLAQLRVARQFRERSR
jgi:hypothetical protein